VLTSREFGLRRPHEKVPLYPPSSLPPGSPLIDELEDWDEEEGDDHPHSSNLHMDTWATLCDGVLAPLRQHMVDQVLARVGSPNRAPRADLRRNVEVMVSSIIANLVILHRQGPPDARLAVPLANTETTRYDRKGFQKLSPTIDALLALGLVGKFAPTFRRLRTTIQARGELLEAVLSPTVNLSDVVRAAGQQRIILTARPPKRHQYGKRIANLWVNYEDNAETRTLRAEMDRLNEFLSTHSITLRGETQPAFNLYRQFTVRSKRSPQAFNLHGRLYGGFWLTLPEAERQHLRIDGEPIADLDFTAMFPSLAYIRAGYSPPKGDPYALRGLEEHRGAAKAAVSALLSSGPLKSLPPRVRTELPQGWTLAKLRKAVIDLHPVLAGSLEQDLSLEMMFTESRILLATLNALMVKDVPALPMHDGMMVPVSKSADAMVAMEAASTAVCGVAIPVVQK
jgi:hypothetical protein